MLNLSFELVSVFCPQRQRVEIGNKYLNMDTNNYTVENHVRSYNFAPNFNVLTHSLQFLQGTAILTEIKLDKKLNKNKNYLTAS